MCCCCSSGVEHFLGKEEVEGSIPFNSSKVLLKFWTASWAKSERAS